jgi:hypothetical protein
LVSLGVLGLIAGLTIPSIVASVETSKKKAGFKEAFQVLSEVVNAGYLNGDFANITDWDAGLSTSPIVQLLTSKLNAIPCPAGSASSGIPQVCKHTIGTNNGPIDHVNIVSARYILPSGVQFWIYTPDSFSSSADHLTFEVESKQSADPNPTWVVGGNNILIVCNLSEQRVFNWNSSSHNIASGHCGPWNGSQAAYDDLFK